MSASLVTSIAQAVAECSKAIGIWMASNERRKMSKAIDYGEKYILMNENQEVIDKVKKSKLKRYRKLFFKYNN